MNSFCGTLKPKDFWAQGVTWKLSALDKVVASISLSRFDPANLYLERQVAQNNRPLYRKVAHKAAKVAPNHRLLAIQVRTLRGRGALNALVCLGSFETHGEHRTFGI